MKCRNEAESFFVTFSEAILSFAKKKGLEISDSFMAALLCIHEERLNQKIVLVSENFSKIQRPNKSEL